MRAAAVLATSSPDSLRGCCERWGAGRPAAAVRTGRRTLPAWPNFTEIV